MPRNKEEPTKQVRIPESLQLGIRELCNLYRAHRDSGNEGAEFSLEVEIVNGVAKWELLNKKHDE